MECVHDVGWQFVPDILRQHISLISTVKWSTKMLEQVDA
jgi:hypothetical protein